MLNYFKKYTLRFLKKFFSMIGLESGKYSPAFAEMLMSFLQILYIVCSISVVAVFMELLGRQHSFWR